MNFKKISTVICAFFIALNCNSAPIKLVTGDKTMSHASWTKLLKANVDETGKVNYKAFVKDKNALDAYLKSLSATKVDELNKDEQIAFWCNVYNAFMIDLVVKNYPVKTVRDIKGTDKVANLAKFGVFKDKLRYTLNGKTYTLYDVENEILRKQYTEPRIHFAIVCASYSCPRLLNEAYEGKTLDEQLSLQAKNFLADGRKNKLSAANGELSKIFDWYKDDFIKTDKSVVNFINKYSNTKLNDKTKIKFIDYNWSLNE